MRDYTKGPWHCKPNANGVYGADGYAITYPIVQAITVLGSDDQSHQWVNRNAEANARLISAAPELLEALELLMKYSARPSCESLHHDKKYRHTALEPCPAEANLYQARIMAEDAIAKAKGKTK